MISHNIDLVRASPPQNGGCKDNSFKKVVGKSSEEIILHYHMYYILNMMYNHVQNPVNYCIHICVFVKYKLNETPKKLLYFSLK